MCFPILKRSLHCKNIVISNARRGVVVCQFDTNRARRFMEIIHRHLYVLYGTVSRFCCRVLDEKVMIKNG
jgi:hypothetical protein